MVNVFTQFDLTEMRILQAAMNDLTLANEFDSSRVLKLRTNIQREVSQREAILNAVYTLSFKHHELEALAEALSATTEISYIVNETHDPLDALLKKIKQILIDVENGAPIQPVPRRSGWEAK